MLPPPALLVPEPPANGHCRTPRCSRAEAAPEGFITPVCRTAAGLEEHSHSPRTVSEQVIPPGYLLTWLFELCKAFPFPIHGGAPNWS